MANDNEGHPEGPPVQPRFCTTCGAALKESDRFCPDCGADIATQEQQRATVVATDPTEVSRVDDEPVPVPRGDPGTSRRRRRPRPWYRRPLVVIPLALLTVLLAIGGVAALRTFNAFNEVNDVSTPPPEISGEALGGDDDLTIDTGPAQEAVREWEIAQSQATESGQSSNPTQPPTETATAPVTPEETDDAEVIGPSRSDGIRSTEETEVTVEATETAGASKTPTETTVLQDPAELADSGTGTNILLMGVDARPGEAIDVGVRPDSLGILNLNEETGTCRILAIPRDSRVTIPGYGESKVNHALAVGGVPFEMLVLEQYLGITIDHYALIDFNGLVAVVDAFGGVTVDNPEAFQMSDHTFAAGEIHLSGEEALLYSRYRGGSDGDFGRVEKQQQVMKALLDEASERNLVNLVPDMWELLRDHFRTDYGMFDMLNTANDFRGVCTSTTIDTLTIPGDVQTLPDDMMQMDLSFVVSNPEDVASSVQWLLTGDAATGATDTATPQSTPVATPDDPATPESTGTTLVASRHDQG